MEDIYATQIQLKGAMEQLFSNFKKDGAERKTPDYIKRRLETLDAYWQEFQSNHIKMCGFGDRSHSYFINGVYEKLGEFYHSTKDFIQKQSRASTPVQPAKLTIPSTSSIRSQGTNSKSEDLLRKQLSQFRAFSRTVSNIDIHSLKHQWEYEDALRSIQSRWSVIDSLHWEIDSELGGENADYEEAFSKHEKTFNDLKKSLNAKMWSVSHRDKSTPQIEIPFFGGSYQQWSSFKDLFIEAIHDNSSLSNAQKMQFLKGKVKGDAEKLIQHLTISSENYDACWEILNNRFNNKKLIFTAHINTLLNVPGMQYQSAASIKRIHDTTNECLHAIKNLGVDTSTWDPLIIHLLAQKLDAETHSDYIESLKNPREIPVLKDFMDYLEAKFTSLETSRRKADNLKSQPHVQPQRDRESPIKHKISNYPFVTNQYNHTNSNTQNKSFINHYSNKNQYSTQTKCPLCKNEHGIFYCKSFLLQNAEQKRNTITKLNLCRNCLINHNGKNCTSEKRCRVCNLGHNTLLHDSFSNVKKFEYKSSKPLHSDENVPSTSNNIHVSRNDLSEILLATALIKVQAADGSFKTLRALIDQGSQTSLISERAAQQLGHRRRHCNGVVFGVGSSENSCRGLITINCTSIHSNYDLTVEVYIMRNLINNLPNRTFEKPSWPYLNSIQLADPDFNVSRPVDILLGADVYPNIILNGIIRENNTPIAQQTQLGWILSGNVTTLQCNVVINNIEELKRFWSTEDIYENNDMSSEDLECIQYYQSTTARQNNGKYVVRIPFKTDFQSRLGNSKSTAIAQFKQLERKFDRQQNIAEKYKLFINEYHDLGHMQKCNRNSILGCYLPHHCVLRDESKSTALRVVFNASSKTSTGFSLNDTMKKGPNLQKDLLTLILKWRQYEFVYTADIEKMFRQIFIHEEDQSFQKIVWRDNPHQALQEYQLTTVTYGTKSAPFLAMMTLKQLAMDEGPKYTQSPVKTVLEEDFYMDDLVSGAFDLDSAKKLQEDLIRIMKSGGFNLRKWTSNKPELLRNVNESYDHTFNFKHTESNKTLGLRWDPINDEFKFQFDMNTSSKFTKRSLLSDISKIFDPLGWLCPVTTKLKLLFQKVWTNYLAWDDKLTEEIKDEWLKIKNELEILNHFHLPRWLSCTKHCDVELHGFCDSSTKAYACVIYSRIININSNKSFITLVAAKSRIVPQNKNITLPRLELCGAHLLSKLMVKVQNSLKGHNINTYGWVDSTAVLGWIQGDPSRWKPFVSNRVRQIVDVMQPECWRYVKSGDNPADCASRGVLPSQLQGHPLWWNGPDWLQNYDHSKQNQIPIYSTDQELKPNKNVNSIIYKIKDNFIQELINKHSSFTRLVRIIAWVRRFASRARITLPYLTTDELKGAKLQLIIHLQKMYFSEEILQLQKDEKVHSKSSLICLNPFLDKNGAMRVGGRLRNAHISEDMKHPLIIPANTHLTDILIDHSHKSTFHGGSRLTLSHIRRNYWIMGGIRAVKKRLRTCITCRRHYPIKHDQLMGDLPSARCNPSRPFYHTGIDFTGYVEVKSNKGRGVKTSKGYIAVFICMATKAVHLELVSDLSSSAFLAALRRMASRRGAPRYIYSDNGTNFVGASRTLQKCFVDLQQILDPALLQELSDMEVEWHFNAPSWPSAGGLWEAAVKSLKYHLRRVIGDQKLTYEEFSTLLTQLEGCLNSRPLCTLSENPEDLSILTPSHFLSSGPTLNIIETESDERKRWQLTQKIFTDVWKRWKMEYLTQLNSRSKWQNKRENLQIDDIVIIHDVNLPPGKWALGRVIDLHPGKDGYVRVVTLKTKTGLIKRPITKISLLTKGSGDPQQKHDTIQKQDITEHRESRRRRNRKPIKVFSTLISTLLFFGFIISGQCINQFNYRQFNNSQALYFEKISNMKIIRDDWKLVAYYNTQPYWQGIKAFTKYVDYLEKGCNNTMQNSTHCNVILTQLRHGGTELEYYNDVLMGQHLRRRKRGFINGVGYLANSLFGVLDQHFAEQYQNDITLIRDNEKHLLQLFKNQTSIIEAENNILKRTEDSINNQYKIINQHIINLQKQTNTVKQEIMYMQLINEFTLSAIIASNMLNNLQNIQNILLDTVTDVHNGQINTHLINPRQLQEQLGIISSHLTNDLSLPIDNIQDIQQVYQLLQIRAKMTQKFLLFEIRIPLTFRDIFELHHVHSVPVQVGNRMRSVVPISDHLAVSLKKDVYVPLSGSEVETCIYHQQLYLCHVHKPFYNMKFEENLCVRDNKNKCETIETECKNRWINLHTLNTYLYFCCNDCSLRLLCEHHVSTVKLNRAGVGTLGQDCIMKSDDLSIYANNPRSSSINISSDIVWPEAAGINHIINITVPLDKVDEVATINNTQLVEIGKQIDHLKSEMVLSDRVSSHDIHHYTAIYVVIMLACAACIAAACRRLRRGRSGRGAAPSPAAPAAAGVAASASVSASVSASDQCGSAFGDLSELRDIHVERSTSPIMKKTVFK